MAGAMVDKQRDRDVRVRGRVSKLVNDKVLRVLCQCAKLYSGHGGTNAEYQCSSLRLAPT
jgi:hypothetical protein